MDSSHQAPLSMGFSRQECWSGLPFPSPGDLLDPGIEPTSPALASRFFTTEPPGKSLVLIFFFFLGVNTIHLVKTELGGTYMFILETLMLLQS